MLIQVTSRDTLMILRLFTVDSFKYGNRFTIVNARRNRAHQGSVKTGTTVDKEALRIMESMILAQQTRELQTADAASPRSLLKTLRDARAALVANKLKFANKLARAIVKVYTSEDNPGDTAAFQVQLATFTRLLEYVRASSA